MSTLVGLGNGAPFELGNACRGQPQGLISVESLHRLGDCCQRVVFLFVGGINHIHDLADLPAQVTFDH